MFIEVSNEDKDYLAEQSRHYEGMSDVDAVSFSVFSFVLPTTHVDSLFHSIDVPCILY